jgi:AraC-like DNA-binding protein
MDASFDKRVGSKALKILAGPERWSLTVPGWTNEAAESPRHREWMKLHQHAHAHLEMMLVLAGRGVYGVGGQLYRYQPGTVLVFPPHIEHDEGMPPWSPSMKRLWISLPSDVSANLYTYRNGRIVRDRYTWFFPLAEVGLSPLLIKAACDTTAHSGAAAQRLRLLGILSLVVSELMAPRRPLEALAEGAIQRQKIDAVRRYIDHARGRGIQLRELARLFDISQFHLVRLFKRQEGCTIHQFVDQCRLQHLHKMMRDVVPRKVIARELGFSSQATFTRWEGKMRRRPA